MANVKSKFKAGDKVRVLRVAAQMEAVGIQEGDIVEVTAAGVDVDFPRVYVNGMDNDGLGFDDSRFELVTPVAPFQLKPNMRVRTRNGLMWIVMERSEEQQKAASGNLFLTRSTEGGGWLNPVFKREDSEWDFVEVFAPPFYFSHALFAESHGKLLWSEAGEQAKQQAKADAEAAVKAAEAKLEEAKAHLATFQ